MGFSREYPERPVIGVGGVIVDRGRTVLIRRGTEPLLGEWSIPGGTIEIGETLEEAVRRELREETGLEVRVLELIELFDRIYRKVQSVASLPLNTGFDAIHEKAILSRTAPLAQKVWAAALGGS